MKIAMTSCFHPNLIHSSVLSKDTGETIHESLLTSNPVLITVPYTELIRLRLTIDSINELHS